MDDEDDSGKIKRLCRTIRKCYPTASAEQYDQFAGCGLGVPGTDFSQSGLDTGEKLCQVLRNWQSKEGEDCDFLKVLDIADQYLGPSLREKFQGHGGDSMNSQESKTQAPKSKGLGEPASCPSSPVPDQGMISDMACTNMKRRKSSSEVDIGLHEPEPVFPVHDDQLQQKSKTFQRMESSLKPADSSKEKSRRLLESERPATLDNSRNFVTSDGDSCYDEACESPSQSLLLSADSWGSRQRTEYEIHGCYFDDGTAPMGLLIKICSGVCVLSDVKILERVQAECTGIQVTELWRFDSYEKFLAWLKKEYNVTGPSLPETQQIHSQRLDEKASSEDFDGAAPELKCSDLLPEKNLLDGTVAILNGEPFMNFVNDNGDVNIQLQLMRQLINRAFNTMVQVNSYMVHTMQHSFVERQQSHPSEARVPQQSRASQTSQDQRTQESGFASGTSSQPPAGTADFLHHANIQSCFVNLEDAEIEQSQYPERNEDVEGGVYEQAEVEAEAGVDRRQSSNETPAIRFRKPANISLFAVNAKGIKLKQNGPRKSTLMRCESTPEGRNRSGWQRGGAGRQRAVSHSHVSHEPSQRQRQFHDNDQSMSTAYRAQPQEGAASLDPADPEVLQMGTETHRTNSPAANTWRMFNSEREVERQYHDHDQSMSQDGTESLDPSDFERFRVGAHQTDLPTTSTCRTNDSGIGSLRTSSSSVSQGVQFPETLKRHQTTTDDLDPAQGAKRSQRHHQRSHDPSLPPDALPYFMNQRSQRGSYRSSQCRETQNLPRPNVPHLLERIIKDGPDHAEAEKRSLELRPPFIGRNQWEAFRQYDQQQTPLSLSNNDQRCGTNSFLSGTLDETAEEKSSQTLHHRNVGRESAFVGTSRNRMRSFAAMPDPRVMQQSRHFPRSLQNTKVKAKYWTTGALMRNTLARDGAKGNDERVNIPVEMVPEANPTRTDSDNDCDDNHSVKSSNEAYQTTNSELQASENTQIQGQIPVDNSSANPRAIDSSSHHLHPDWLHAVLIILVIILSVLYGHS